MTTDLEVLFPDPMKVITDVEKAMQSASAQLKESNELIRRQNKMIELALDEFLRLAETEAIPLFFRKQMIGTVTRMKEIGFDSHA